MGAAVGSVGAAAGSGRVGGPLPEGGGEERRDHDVVTTPQLTRTPKLLVGMSVAQHVVTFEWLKACRLAGGRVDEAPFVVKDEAKEQLWGFSLSWSLAQNPSRKVLTGYALALAPDARTLAAAKGLNLPNSDELRVVVECAGGWWLEDLSGVGSESSRVHWPLGLVLIGYAESFEGTPVSVSHTDEIMWEPTPCVAALAKLERGLLAGFFYPEDLYCTILSKKLKLSLPVGKLAEQLRGPWDLRDDSEPRELTV